MTNLNKKAFEGLAQMIVAMAVLLFLPAWSVDYVQAWAFLGVFGVSTLAVTVYLMKHDPALLQRRVEAGPGAEKERKQKIIQSIASVWFIAIFVVSALDHRFAWSVVAPIAWVIGDVLVALGLYIVFLVFKANTFTSATIETDKEQQVISTGPYAVVRHPMYAGAFVMLVGVPLALDSLWGLVPVALIMAVIIWRLLEEERFLNKNLAGYVEYCHKVRSRLVPWVW